MIAVFVHQSSSRVKRTGYDVRKRHTAVCRHAAVQQYRIRRVRQTQANMHVPGIPGTAVQRQSLSNFSYVAHHRCSVLLPCVQEQQQQALSPCVANDRVFKVHRRAVLAAIRYRYSKQQAAAAAVVCRVPGVYSLSCFAVDRRPQGTISKKSSQGILKTCNRCRSLKKA